MRSLRIGHTPDADDAFMFFGLSTGAVKIPGHDVEFVLEDIQSLNLRAEKGEIDVTAISAAAYPVINHHYWVLSAGASVGRHYGPILVSKENVDFSKSLPVHSRLDLRGRRVAIPGSKTTAALLLNLYAMNFEVLRVAFDQVFPAVKEGRAHLGLVIHEGQITFQNHGLHKILDLGERWASEFNLPIPLGLDVVKKSLGEPLAKQIDSALRESIRWAQSHREEALRFALQFGRGVQTSVLDRFVDMYVNNDTLNLGPEGRAALQTLFRKAKDLSFLTSVPSIDIIEG